MDQHPPTADPDRLSGERWLAHYCRAAAAGSGALGALVLLGWVLGIEPLKRGAPGLVAMNPTTAVAFMLAGLALWLLRTPGGGTRSRRLGAAGAAALVGLSVLKIAEYFVGGDLGVDRLLLRSALEAEKGIPNTIAPNTAVVFGLLGGAMLLLDRKVARRYRPAELLALGAAAIALLACIGYLYRAGPLYGVADLIPMAVHTAAGLLMVATGVLASRSEHAIASQFVSRRSGGLIARRLLPGAIGIVLALGWLRLKGEQLGLYGNEFGVSLMSAMSVFLIFGLSWSIAAALDRADARREVAESGLRRAHATMRENSELLRAILDSVGDGIIVSDGAGRLLLHNPAAERLLVAESGGAPLAEWEGHPGLMLPDALTPFPAEDLALRRACAGETVHDQEQYFRSAPGGEPHWLSVSAEPLRGWRAEAAVVVVRDVTARKLVEQRLASQKDALEVLVASRTADLQRSNDELRQFAYVASHDLQEPLRMVASYLQLLQRRYQASLDTDANEFIEYAVDGANRMKQLINDLLQFSRVDRKGGTIVETESRDIVDEAVANLSVALAEAGGRVALGPLPTIDADPTQLRQLFQNLLANAVKFRGDEPPDIRVSAERTGEGWVFAVADNGIGLDPQYAERIFEVFQRLHDRAKYPGTGIGLAICKKIVERHGGRIWVEARANGGATFRFTIPQKKGTSDANRLAA